MGKGWHGGTKGIVEHRGKFNQSADDSNVVGGNE